MRYRQVCYDNSVGVRFSNEDARVLTQVVSVVREGTWLVFHLVLGSHGQSGSEGDKSFLGIVLHCSLPVFVYFTRL